MNEEELNKIKSIDAPFTRTHLGETPKVDSFTVRMNAEERERINELKKDLDIKGDSTALKELAFVGANVLQSLFPNGKLRYLFKKDRKRLSDYENF